jgi:hypothetical protein
MKRFSVLALGALALVSIAFADEHGDWWRYKSFSGSYLVYSGDLGEEQPPKQDDRKVSFMVKGPLAKEMFDAMYPDAKERCSDDKGYRERNKENVSCTHDRDGYACHFGFDLRNGRSIPGATC